MFTCPEECFNEKQNTIRDRLAEHLWDAYKKFLENEYIYIRESDTSEGFSRFEVVDVIETEEVEIRFEIYSVAFYRGNSCGGELRHLSYYIKPLEGFMYDSLMEFIKWLREECGGYEI
jgi:6-pyruvoyl-tetrahydropterin synthase